MLILFWLSVLAVFYTYFGYPLCLIALSAFKKSDNLNFNETENNYFPNVSFIITAYNEEHRIEQKIDGTLLQDYPKDKLEIIVASDCSNDRTDEIVKSYAEKGVRLVRVEERKGKENAQKHAVEASKGEILIFSDLATILEQDGISNIVKKFSDPSIGCVSSDDRFIDKDGSVSGEGAYVRYEMFLRRLESKVNTLVGLSGSFFAARREVCINWATDLQSDFNTLLNSIKIGLRGVIDPNSVGYYKNISDEKKEFNRKVRTILRGISVFMRSIELLNPLRHGIFSFQLFSHKLCRWLVPFFLITSIISNVLILNLSVFYIQLFMFQLIFYFFAFLYWIIKFTEERNRDVVSSDMPPQGGAELFSIFAKVFKIPYYFVMVNISILVAWCKFIKGERKTFWEPSKRI